MRKDVIILVDVDFQFVGAYQSEHSMIASLNSERDAPDCQFYLFNEHGKRCLHCEWRSPHGQFIEDFKGYVIRTKIK